MIAPQDLARLRAFAVVAEERSFTRAAAILGVSASALSQTVRQLEERIGTGLLNRTTRSVSPTEAGRVLLQQVAPALAALGEAMDGARRAGGRVSGTVRLHSFRLGSELFLQPLFAHIAERHPEITLDLTVGDEVVDVVAGGFDAAIRVGEVIERDMVAIRLGGDLRQVAVASPAYLARCGAPTTPHDLVGHACLCWRWAGRPTPYRWEFCKNGRWFEVAVSGPLIADDRATCVRAAENGAGIAFAVEEAIAPLVRSGRLVMLLEAWSAPFPGFFLCYPQQRRMLPALRVLVDTLKEARVL